MKGDLAASVTLANGRSRGESLAGRNEIGHYVLLQPRAASLSLSLSHSAEPTRNSPLSLCTVLSLPFPVVPFLPPSPLAIVRHSVVFGLFSLQACQTLLEPVPATFRQRRTIHWLPRFPSLWRCDHLCLCSASSCECLSPRHMFSCARSHKTASFLSRNSMTPLSVRSPVSA